MSIPYIKLIKDEGRESFKSPKEREMAFVVLILHLISPAINLRFVVVKRRK